ncbi:MAG TPA: hypothetical protein VF219_08820, partial [Vicinamibacterales bacterium]
MPCFTVPTNASIHAARALFQSNNFFSRDSNEAVLRLHPKWSHVEPIALVMIASWGAWCRAKGYALRVENLGKPAAYAARMKLFQLLGVDFDP